MGMNYFEVFMAINSVGTQVAIEVYQALKDGELDGKELTGIVKTGIRSLRMAGVSHDDLDKILMVTSKAEYDMLPFKDGDVLFYAPSELTDKLSIKT